MIHYHGLPITPEDAAAIILAGGHAFISFAHPEQLTLACEVCQSFALDNGAFSVWRTKGGNRQDWTDYYRWTERVLRLPGCDWAVIPDVIGGGEEANDALLAEWPHGQRGVPVWHMQESLHRLAALVAAWPRVAIGSAGQFASVGTDKWWNRMCEIMSIICDSDGLPRCKVHGLRMLDSEVFSRLPLASADSCAVARNIGIDAAWTGSYRPPTKATRGVVLRARIEATNGASAWAGRAKQMDLF